MLFIWFSRLYHFLVFLIILGFFVHIFAPILVEASPIPNVFINEIHYDNSGTDKNEFIEIMGTSGLNLNGWSLHFYNGRDGKKYKTYTFSNWLLNDYTNGLGIAGVNISGIQNGAPDGVALTDKNNNIVQFLSYEGSFIASSGVATGLSSIDIGVYEPANTPFGFSLQLTGQGTTYADFTWSYAQPNTFGNINVGQSITYRGEKLISVKEPTSLILFLMAFVIVIHNQRVKMLPL